MDVRSLIREVRRQWLPIVACTAAITVLLCLLAVWIEGVIPNIRVRQNLWLGTDIPRFVNWSGCGKFRLELHPLVRGLYCAYGDWLEGRGIAVTAAPLAVLTLPAALINSAVLSASLCGLAGSERRWIGPLFVAIGCVVGPLVLLGPIPESHLFGGAFLLAELAILAPALGSGRVTWAHLIAAAVAAVLATSCTITNVVPAGLLLGVAFAYSGVLGARAMAWLMIGVLVGAAICLDAFQDWLVRIIAFEAGFMDPPSATAFLHSLRSMVVSHLGVPFVELGPIVDPFDPVFALRVNPRVGALPAVAVLLWYAGLALAWARMQWTRYERALLVGCLAATIAVVGLHTIYGSYEAYMFSPHCWPYVLVPGLLVLRRPRALRDKLVVRLLVGALCAAALQFALGAFVLLTTWSLGAPQ